MKSSAAPSTRGRYDHPKVACTSRAPTTPSGGFSASVHNVGGNTWWVETDVGASGGALAGADARG